MIRENFPLEKLGRLNLRKFSPLENNQLNSITIIIVEIVIFTIMNTIARRWDDTINTLLYCNTQQSGTGIDTSFNVSIHGLLQYIGCITIIGCTDLNNMTCYYMGANLDKYMLS